MPRKPASTEHRTMYGMFKVISLATLCFVLGNGCDKKAENPVGANLPEVTLQLNWKPEPQFGGFYAAEVEGVFRRHGLDVTITAGGAGAPTVEMIGAGTVAFAIVSGDEIIRARAKGNRVVALFAVFQTNPQAIMTRASRGLKTLADLLRSEGILAIERGLPYSDFLERKYGFDSLKIVPSPFGDLSLYRTQVKYAMQCFVTSEPLAARAMGIEPQTFLIAESGYNPYTTVLATSEAYLKANPKIVGALLEAVRAGWKSYLDDPTKTNQHMNKLNPTMDARTFEESAAAQQPLIDTDITSQMGLGAMTRERWETLIKQLLDLEVIEKTVDAREVFVNIAAAK